jgi:uracil-DNA glycosylase
MEVIDILLKNSLYQKTVRIVKILPWVLWYHMPVITGSTSAKDILNISLRKKMNMSQETQKIIDLKEVEAKLIDKLKQTGWYEPLRGYFIGSDFMKILRYLAAEAKDGRRFTPPVKYLFNAFEQCPYKDLKVVIVSLDPYPYVNVANGIAFDCSLTGRIQSSLKYIFKDIQKNIYNNDFYNWDPDLSRWANQGVLLLNSALTVEIGNIGAHKDLWKPFMTHTIKTIAERRPGTMWCFLGKHAESYAHLVPELYNKIHKTSHPASAAYANLEYWNSGKMFNEINNYLKSQNIKQITW